MDTKEIVHHCLMIIFDRVVCGYLMFAQRSR